MDLSISLTHPQKCPVREGTKRILRVNDCQARQFLPLIVPEVTRRVFRTSGTISRRRDRFGDISGDGFGKVVVRRALMQNNRETMFCSFSCETFRCLPRPYIISSSRIQGSLSLSISFYLSLSLSISLSISLYPSLSLTAHKTAHNNC